MSKINCKKLMKEFRELPCLICLGTNQVSGHHIFGKGAYPTLRNSRVNIIPLCFKHHRDAHDMDSRELFIKTYNLEEMMIERGFEQHDNGTWFIPFGVLHRMEVEQRVKGRFFNEDI
jgi:hypothetical protein